MDAVQDHVVHRGRLEVGEDAWRLEVEVDGTGRRRVGWVAPCWAWWGVCDRAHGHSLALLRVFPTHWERCVPL